MFGLGYPGGPIISKLASEYTGKRKRLFPVVLLENDTLDFSFSGIKSAVKREMDKRKANGTFDTDDMRELAFEFETAVTDILITKLFRAQERYQTPCVLLAG